MKLLAAIADNNRTLTTAVQAIQCDIEMGACKTVVKTETEGK